LGLGLGALLPAVASVLAGKTELKEEAPELWPSSVLLCVSLAFMVWVFAAFPRHLHFLPDAVRFAPGIGNLTLQTEPIDRGRMEAAKFRKELLISGTARVFVQSAIMPVVGLLMHDAHLTGQFRQSAVVAILYLLQLPFQALASRLCCACSTRPSSRSGIDFQRVFGGGAIALLTAIAGSLHFTTFHGVLPVLLGRLLQLAALVATLAVAAPVNASRLYQLEDAERAIVILEWMKAYIGRLLGPFVAVVIYSFFGYGSVLMLLCCATCVVAITA